MVLTFELFAAIIIPTMIGSIAIGCMLYRKCWWAPSGHKAVISSRRTAPQGVKCYDVESHGESDGPSPRSQTLLRQLETLVGRVVENKLEQVMCAGSKDEDGKIEVICDGAKADEYEEKTEGSAVDTMQTKCLTRSWPSQTEQLDCLAPVPKKWLTPSSPQARKDPMLPSSIMSPGKKAECIRGSTEALKQRLRARESQVQNLSSQLKDSRQKLWECLKDHLAERAYVQQNTPDGANDGVTLLQYEKKVLTEKLNKETMRASKWAMIAKQQRLYLLQNESIGNEPDALQKHAAGIVFTAPPPCPDEDYGVVWDVSNGAGANPYVIDSWPMEPNSLAQRYPKDVPFGECVDEDGESDSDSASEKDAWMDRSAAISGMCLPRLPSSGEAGALAAWSSRSDRSVRSARSF